MSRYFYGSKRIYFYMGTYVTAEWDKYIEEIEGLHLTVTNFTVSNTFRSNIDISLFKLKENYNNAVAITI